jgi:hypothetical protein
MTEKPVIQCEQCGGQLFTEQVAYRLWRDGGTHHRMQEVRFFACYECHRTIRVADASVGTSEEKNAL